MDRWPRYAISCEGDQAEELDYRKVNRPYPLQHEELGQTSRSQARLGPKEPER